MSDFVHLHCHSEFSFFQSTIRIPELCTRAVELKMPAVALTDIDNLHGAIHFYTTARDYGLKPIIGCEIGIYSALNPQAKSGSIPKKYSLTLLAMNKTGFNSLISLSSLGFMNNPAQKPGITREQLTEHNAGMIALSGGSSGPISYVLKHFGMDQAINAATQYSEIFPGRFYLEMQSCELSRQKKLNQQLVELSQASSLPLIATNDCRYLYDYESEIFETLLRLKKNNLPPETDQESFPSKGLHFTTPDEMQKAFAHIPQAIENTIHISSLCDLDLGLDSRSVFVSSPPKGKTWESILRSNALKGLEHRIQAMDIEENNEIYYNRLVQELDSICSHGLAEYFVVLEDIVEWSRQHDIPMSPGRGTAPSSLVNYALGITNVDPVKFNLFFERFIDIHNNNFPDVSIDFCFERRSEVLGYVQNIYGWNKAVPTCTFMRRTFPKALREIGDMLNINPAKIESIANMEPFNRRPFYPGITFEKCPEINLTFEKEINSDNVLRHVLYLAWNLHRLICGYCHNESVISITNRSHDDAVPICLEQTGKPLSQWHKHSISTLGIPSFDFLGLKNLTLNKKTCDLAESKGKTVPDLNQLPLDDSVALQLFDRADTEGIFNFGSQGIRELLKKCAPNSFEDLVALNALYRPGPLEIGMIDEFIACKHGQKEIKHQPPKLESILKETYGLIIYQEQVMEIAQVIAGYSLDDANTLRKVLGKKDAKQMTRHKEVFLQGAADQNIDSVNAEDIFDILEKYTAYSFSKSHSVAYTLIGYQSAYLKAHFPDEFMNAYEEIFNR